MNNKYMIKLDADCLDSEGNYVVEVYENGYFTEEMSYRTKSLNEALTVMIKKANQLGLYTRKLCEGFYVTESESEMDFETYTDSNSKNSRPVLLESFK